MGHFLNLVHYNPLNSQAGKNKESE